MKTLFKCFLNIKILTHILNLNLKALNLKCTFYLKNFINMHNIKYSIF